MGYLTISTNVRRYQTHHRWHFSFFFQKDTTLAHMHCACNTVQLLRRSRLPFSWTMLPTAPSWTHWLQDLGSNIAAWVVRQKDWTNQGATGWILAMHGYSSEWKMWFSCFPVLPGSAEAHVIWGGIVKRLSTAYFIGNISAQKYQNAFTYVKVIANQTWDVFETQCIYSHCFLFFASLLSVFVCLYQRVCI